MPQIRGMSPLRTSDEPSVRIGLRRELQVSTKPVSGKLFVLDQLDCSVSGAQRRLECRMSR
eukprot:6173302-Prymnesium_polylepis.1